MVFIKAITIPGINKPPSRNPKLQHFISR